MNCPNCGTENPAQARFCTDCGTSLVPTDGSIACPNCRVDNPASARFCNSCGTPLAFDCPQCNRRYAGEGLFCRWCDQLITGPSGIKAAGLGRRVAAYILDILLILPTLILGYIIWWLFALRRGQTPGKQLLKIRVIRTDGRASDWGWTFVREALIKFGLFELAIDSVSFGIGSLLDKVWAFWDKDRQALHDKIVKTVFVDDREFRSRSTETPTTTP